MKTAPVVCLFVSRISLKLHNRENSINAHWGLKLFHLSVPPMHLCFWLWPLNVEILMRQMLVMSCKCRGRKSENTKKLLEENPGGAGEIEHISEPLPGMIGFMCYPVIP